MRRNLLSERYGPIYEPSPFNANDCINTLLEHRSVRDFAATPVPAGALNSAISSAQSASSSSNLQPWSVIGVRDPHRKAELAMLSNRQVHIERCPLFLVWVVDHAQLRRIAGEAGLHLDGLDYLDAFLESVIDTAMAAQNAAIAFESLGLGIVFIGAVRNHALEFARVLSLPKTTFPLFGMCVGYPDPGSAQRVKPRLARRCVMHEETYAAGRPDDIRAYELTLGCFYSDQGLGRPSWCRRSFAGSRMALRCTAAKTFARLSTPWISNCADQSGRRDDL